ARDRDPDLPVLDLAQHDLLLVPLDEQAGIDEPGVRDELVHGVFRVHGPGRFEDLPEQLLAGVLRSDLAQVGPDVDADAVGAMTALAVDDGFGGEDRPAAPGIP